MALGLRALKGTLSVLLCLALARPPAWADHEHGHPAAPAPDQAPLSAPTVPGLLFPDPIAARSALGEEDYARYQADLGRLTELSPFRERYRAEARRLAGHWRERLWERVFASPAESALVEHLARGRGGRAGLTQELVRAVNAGRGEEFIAPLRTQAQTLAREQLLLGARGESTAAGRALRTRNVREEAVLGYVCAEEPERPSAGAAGAQEQAEGLERAGERASFERTAPPPVDPRAGLSPDERLAEHCSNWRRRQQWSRPGQPAQSLAGRPVPAPGEDRRKKKREERLENLQKDAIGGLFGAVGLGVVGFILGGPPGAVIGATIGFIAMAAVVHVSNNPIGKKSDAPE